MIISLDLDGPSPALTPAEQATRSWMPSLPLPPAFSLDSHALPGHTANLSPAPAARPTAQPENLSLKCKVSSYNSIVSGYSIVSGGREAGRLRVVPLPAVLLS